MLYQNSINERSGSGTHNSTPRFSRHHSPNVLLQDPMSESLSTPKSRFRRYSLADTKLVSSPKSNNSPYNTHISTRIDSDSPGFSSRVVQYNTEQEKLLPTCQSKYDKLGVFPIVHFFKKDLPHLNRKSNEAYNSSELSKYNSPEHNRMLLEKIIKSSPVTDAISSNKKEVNTKSVLDALKEISRKRIQSNEDEFILKDDGKRIHVNHDSESISRKRIRQNLSQLDDSCTQNVSIAPFNSINELIASHSSMDGYGDKPPKRQKIKDTADTSLKVTKSVNFVDVETQTLTPQVTARTQTVSESEKTNEKENDVEEVKVQKISPVKVFDESPLENMRKNRLTALMTSVKPNTPKKQEEPNESNVEEKIVFDKPLVSILAGPAKSSSKNNKHVTFNIPETSSVSLDTSTENDTLQSGINLVTKTSAALVTPIVSASVVEVAPIIKTANTEQLTPSSKSYELNTTNLTSSQLNTSIDVSITNDSAAKDNKTNVEKDVEKTKLPNNPGVFVPSTKENQGGFKFELKQPNIATTTVSSVPFSFISSSTSLSNTTPPVTQKATFNFTPPVSLNVSNQKGFVAFNNVTSTAKFNPGQITNSPSNFLGISTPVLTQSTATSTKSSLSFMPPPPSSTFSTNAKSSLFTFVSKNNPSTTSSAVTLSSAVTNVTSSSVFPIVSSAAQPGASNFEAQNRFIASPSSVFNKPVSGFITTPSSTFSENINKTSTNNTFSFGPSNLSFNTKAPSFNNVANFGNDSSNKSVFGQGTVTPSFTAPTTTAAIGNNNTSATFGNPTNNIFGSTSNFAPPSFSSNTTGTSFGTSQNPPFNNISSNQKSGNTAFGTTTNTPFGFTTNSTPSFAVNTATVTNSSGFGTSNNFVQSSSTFSPFEKSSNNSEVVSFGNSSSSFGNSNFTSNNQSSVFNFGPSNTTKPGVFSFGSSEAPKPSFNFSTDNNSNAFGVNNKSPFGASSPSFTSVPNQFNVQPVGAAMFNIGTGGSSTPTRARVQHKAKRRT